MLELDIFIDRLIAREGGFVDHPVDRGGPTNMGITHKTLARWRKGEYVTVDDVENLSVEEARAIYRSMYWQEPGFDTLHFLSPVMSEMLFDAAVHHGPRRAVRFLQYAAMVTVDGSLGPVTRQAVMTAPRKLLAARYIGRRTAFIGRIVTRIPGQAVFAEGWNKRMQEFIERIPLA